MREHGQHTANRLHRARVDRQDATSGDCALYAEDIHSVGDFLLEGIRRGAANLGRTVDAIQGLSDGGHRAAAWRKLVSFAAKPRKAASARTSGHGLWATPPRPMRTSRSLRYLARVGK